MITAITPTGDRHLAFDLCRRWIAAQTVKPDQWIIVDDGRAPMEIKFDEPYAQYIRRAPRPDDPKHTLVVNIECALSYVRGDRVFFIEDDEYYAPDYIECLNHQLWDYQLVGIGCSKYYHLPTGGYTQHANMKHASLAQTAYRAELTPLVAHCVAQGMEKYWLDDRIWRAARDTEEKKKKTLIFNDEVNPLYAGIKGLPGRTGIGIGHKPASYREHDNDSRDQLKKWIPRDYQVYLDLLEEKLCASSSS